MNAHHMIRVLYPLLLFLISSCVSPESRFVHIHEIDFSGHNDYSVCDTRESSIYWIGYQGEEYWVRYPLGSDKIIKLQRAYKDREIDSLSIEFGKGPFREDLATDTPLALMFQDICDTYKQIWQIDSKRLYVREVYVNGENDVLMNIVWKPKDEMYRVLLSARKEDALMKFDDITPNPESFHLNEYKEIEPGLYYRFDGKFNPRH